MPTPSEPQPKSEFGVGSSPPRRSIFGNYKPEDMAADAPTLHAPTHLPSIADGAEGGRRPGEEATRFMAPIHGHSLEVRPAPSGTMVFPNCGGKSSSQRELCGAPALALQSSIDAALARSFLYRFLAKAYEIPDPEGWMWMSSEPTKAAFRSAVQALEPSTPPSLRGAAVELLNRLEPGMFDHFQYACTICFGHTVRGDCPMNEIEYGDIKADPLFQPHRLADLGAFYAAFGLEMTADAGERQDHISIELEFMSVLIAKEAYALEYQLDGDRTLLCRQAQMKFLHEHLARWTPAFTRRLARMAAGTALGALADFTREMITEDCARFQLTPGSEDIRLRPIDEESESLCASCGLTNLPPGALAGGPTP